ncbi:MAG TPA: alpha/beta hydrolase [Polyangiaceae bacterium]|jgi:pimeloyl-ACP methyl ester carboxylesterase
MRLVKLAFSLSLLASAACAASNQAPPAASVTSSRVATASSGSPRPPFQARSFSVRVVGHGAPMVLVPGLACAGAVWDDFVRHYQDRFELHVLTLAGFAGEKPISGPLLETVRADLADYIRDHVSGKPVVVGHSLGGALGFWLAEEAPERVAAVVAVDGVPFLPALTDPSATPEGMAPMAKQMAEGLAHAPPEAFRAQNRAVATSMVTDPAQVDRIASWGAASDQATVGGAMAELMTHDLRAHEDRIRVPVLLFAATQGAPGAAARYEAQIAKIPDHRVAVDDHSRHFLMLDDPAFLYSTLDAFLLSLAPKEGAHS